MNIDYNMNVFVFKYDVRVYKPIFVVCSFQRSMYSCCFCGYGISLGRSLFYVLRASLPSATTVVFPTVSQLFIFAARQYLLVKCFYKTTFYKILYFIIAYIIFYDISRDIFSYKNRSTINFFKFFVIYSYAQKH